MLGIIVYQNKAAHLNHFCFIQAFEFSYCISKAVKIKNRIIVISFKTPALLKHNQSINHFLFLKSELAVFISIRHSYIII